MGFGRKFLIEEDVRKLDRKDVGKIIARARGNRRIPLQTIILGTLAVTGVLATALVAPNAVRLFDYLNPISRRNSIRFNQRIKQAILRLEQRGLIKVIGEGKKIKPQRSRENYCASARESACSSPNNHSRHACSHRRPRDCAYCSERLAAF